MVDIGCVITSNVSRCWTKLTDVAVRAIRLARGAAAAAMPDEPVAPQGPIVLRHQFHQFLLDFDGVGALHQTEPVAEPRDVRVHHHANVDVEGVAEDNIRRLAPDAGERV